MTHKVRLLETTLRDGSYEIDFQFTAEASAFLVCALDRAGVGYIEIGHGNGIGTTRWNPQPKSIGAAATDEEHLEAAQAAVERTKLGVLMVAGERFAPLEVLELLPKYGFHYVRLGLEPRDAMTPLSMKYIARARELGLLVSVNQMQTYA